MGMMKKLTFRTWTSALVALSFFASNSASADDYYYDGGGYGGGSGCCSSWNSNWMCWIGGAVLGAAAGAGTGYAAGHARDHKGKKGRRGETGPTGATGTTGATGAVGPAGPFGPTGDMGVSGENGVSGDPGLDGDPANINTTDAIAVDFVTNAITVGNTLTLSVELIDPQGSVLPVTIPVITAATAPGSIFALAAADPKFNGTYTLILRTTADSSEPTAVGTFNLNGTMVTFPNIGPAVIEWTTVPQTAVADQFILP